MVMKGRGLIFPSFTFHFFGSFLHFLLTPISQMKLTLPFYFLPLPSSQRLILPVCPIIFYLTDNACAGVDLAFLIIRTDLFLFCLHYNQFIRVFLISSFSFCVFYHGSHWQWHGARQSGFFFLLLTIQQGNIGS